VILVDKDGNRVESPLQTQSKQTGLRESKEQIPTSKAKVEQITTQEQRVEKCRLWTDNVVFIGTPVVRLD